MLPHSYDRTLCPNELPRLHFSNVTSIQAVCPLKCSDLAPNFLDTYSSQRTMLEHYNYIGAATFWSYILAALYLTGTITHSLHQQYNHVSTSLSPSRQRFFHIFTALAALSFATLSFNMLHVLIASFQLWRTTHPSTISPSNAIQTIWHWSIRSTLFQDFARAIVANDNRALWTRTELLWTFGVVLWMGQRGRSILLHTTL